MNENDENKKQTFILHLINTTPFFNTLVFRSLGPIRSQALFKQVAAT